MARTKRVKLSAFRLSEYGPEGPSLRAMRQWCENGDLPAEKIGKCWYVLVGSVKRDRLLDQILAA